MCTVRLCAVTPDQGRAAQSAPPGPGGAPSPSETYCEICTFTFCNGMREQFPVGRTLDRFGNA